MGRRGCYQRVDERNPVLVEVAGGAAEEGCQSFPSEAGAADGGRDVGAVGSQLLGCQDPVADAVLSAAGALLWLSGSALGAVGVALGAGSDGTGPAAGEAWGGAGAVRAVRADGSAIAIAGADRTEPPAGAAFLVEA